MRKAELIKLVERLQEENVHLDHLARAYRERLRQHTHDADGRAMWNGVRAKLDTDDMTEAEVRDMTEVRQTDEP